MSFDVHLVVRRRRIVAAALAGEPRRIRGPASPAFLQSTSFLKQLGDEDR